MERVYIDRDKNYWIKFYEEGIFCYNVKSKKVTEFKMGYGPNQIKEHYGIAAMTDYPSGLVIMTYTGELVCLNGKTGAIEWENTWMHDNGVLQSQNYKLLIDKEENLYVVAEHFTYIFILKEMRWYNTVRDLMLSRGIEGLPEGLQVWDVKIDDKDRMWVATDHEGLFVIDPKDKEVRQLLNNKFDESTLSDNTPRQVYVDQLGHVWISTYKNGVNEFKEGLASITSLDQLGDINTVVEDKHGYYWLGSNTDGIFVYDPRTNEVVNHYTKDNSPMTGNIMVGSCRAKDGSIWFGSYNGGLTRCIPSAEDPRQATIINWSVTGAPDGLSTNNVWSVTEDKWHRIWIATLGGGIQMLDLKTGKFRTWNQKNTPTDCRATI